MLIQHLISRRALHTFRAPSLLQFPLPRFPRHALQNLNRRLASSTIPKKPRAKQSKLSNNTKTLSLSDLVTAFPERLLVYHAGTGRTVFLGSLKVTTIFIATFFCAVLGPTYFYAEDQPPWVSVVGM